MTRRTTDAVATRNTNVQLDPLRRTDRGGDPLTKAEGRVKDLRDSGYRGWVDWNTGERLTDDEVGW
ncbi:hypothetical protein [Frankia sp. Cj3]|uniref:hypothetical protein n=1 Tax=Frankia sp. Cj3 TaxID=2880976 RepID=UPI001EF559DE|nr:hypothetical protein [Frankia sp. Cj3]